MSEGSISFPVSNLQLKLHPASRGFITKRRTSRKRLPAKKEEGAFPEMSDIHLLCTPHFIQTNLRDLGDCERLKKSGCNGYLTLQRKSISITAGQGKAHTFQRDRLQNYCQEE